LGTRTPRSDANCPIGRQLFPLIFDQLHPKRTLSIFRRIFPKILTRRSWPSTLRRLPRASSRRPSTSTLTSATGTGSTTPLSPPLWKIKRCRCKVPSNGLYHFQTAVHYRSIILTVILFEHTSRPAVTKAERDGTSDVQVKRSIGGDNSGYFIPRDSWECVLRQTLLTDSVYILAGSLPLLM